MSGRIAPRRKRAQRKSVILDPIHPTDFLRLPFTYCCEQCVHVDLDKEVCSLGYDFSIHRRKAQLQAYELSGKMAFCRFLEID